MNSYSEMDFPVWAKKGLRIDVYATFRGAAVSFYIRTVKTRRGAFPGLLRVLFLDGVQIVFFEVACFRL